MSLEKLIGVETDFRSEEIADAAAAKQNQPADEPEGKAEIGEDDGAATVEDADTIAAIAQDLINDPQSEGDDAMMEKRAADVKKEDIGRQSRKG
ncbi:hypothetical protein HBA54_27415 [Pelagibius litoralis]|uniref:Uncharacterized protein n=1 Tax=Pelagibius litoralis TaxID=374515 RepID=A0A967F350_9PROT|nr:hypothetical protein [Pelagibius litoralis]NIA72324.1 hypothetical protein [Pelagibius litoralis]